MDQAHGHRALADRRCDPLDRARADVTDGKDAGSAGLEEERRLAFELDELVAVKFTAGQQETAFVSSQLPREPLGVW